jgi:hypothetical protein
MTSNSLPDSQLCKSQILRQGPILQANFTSSLMKIEQNASTDFLSYKLFKFDRPLPHFRALSLLPEKLSQNFRSFEN